MHSKVFSKVVNSLVGVVNLKPRLVILGLGRPRSIHGLYQRVELSGSPTVWKLRARSIDCIPE